MHTETSNHNSPGFGRNTGGWGIVIVALVAILLALMAWWLWNSGSKEVDHYRLSNTHSSHNDHNSEVPVSEAAALAPGMADPDKFGKVDTRGNFIYVLGDSITLRLPDSTLLRVPENSTEAKLIAFLIEEKNQVNNDDKTQGWITCDRIFFETGDDALTADSKLQIANLSTILRAFPGASIKVGGYTDSTGNAATNAKLSEERAAAVAAMLAADGAKNTVEHEGYGQQWPLASNETEAGRAMNRRVDIRVTKK